MEDVAAGVLYFEISDIADTDTAKKGIIWEHVTRMGALWTASHLIIAVMPKMRNDRENASCRWKVNFLNVLGLKKNMAPTFISKRALLPTQCAA
jgi:hypothetical protein